MSKGSLITANSTHLFIRCLIIVFLVVGASGATLWVMDDRSDVNIVFALDASASMTSSDVGDSRFETAKSIVSSSLNNMPRGGEYALINFAGVSLIQQSFTQERAELLLSLEESEIARIGGTDVGGAIITATNLFELKPDEGKVLIILSDGLDNTGAFISGSPHETVTYAKENQVVIHSIAIGTEGGPVGFLPEYFEVPSMFDDELMNFMEEETGGSFHRVESLDDVQGVVSELDFETTRAYVNYNLFYWSFLVIFLLLIFEWVIANTVYRRVL